MQRQWSKYWVLSTPKTLLMMALNWTCKLLRKNTLDLNELILQLEALQKYFIIFLIKLAWSMKAYIFRRMSSAKQMWERLRQIPLPKLKLFSNFWTHHSVLYLTIIQSKNIQICIE